MSFILLAFGKVWSYKENQFQTRIPVPLRKSFILVATTLRAYGTVCTKFMV